MFYQSAATLPYRLLCRAGGYIEHKRFSPLMCWQSAVHFYHFSVYSTLLADTLFPSFITEKNTYFIDCLDWIRCWNKELPPSKNTQCSGNPSWETPVEQNDHYSLPSILQSLFTPLIRQLFCTTRSQIHRRGPGDFRWALEVRVSQT